MLSGTLTQNGTWKCRLISDGEMGHGRNLVQKAERLFPRETGKSIWATVTIRRNYLHTSANSDIDGILIVTTTQWGVLTNKQNECDLAGLFPCNHSEADSRIMLHLMHAASQSYTDAYVRTVDSDIVVLAIAFFDQLRLSKLRIGVGTGKHCRDTPVHDIKSALGPTRLLALPLFHSLSSCDTTS